MLFSRFACVLAALVFLSIPPVLAQEGPQDAPEAGGILTLLPDDVKTEHVLETAKGKLTYQATAGTLTLFGQNGKPTAKIFYTAYTAKDGGSQRPLTFVFNGGPGAASAYLHLGLVGPRIVRFDAAAKSGTTPSLADNPQSWLDFTDLVLIDPVGTGWSRASDSETAGNFYGVRQDADSLAKVISLYVQRNDRLASPKYLLGESYGGFRAAKVASALKKDQGILVAGIVMLSPLIEGQLLFGATDYPLGAALQLPSLAAAELERRNVFTVEAVNNAEQFAMGEYMQKLAGPEPKGEEARSFYRRLAELTGIPADTIARTRGFLGDIYTKTSVSGSVVSPYDAGQAVADPYPESLVDHADDPVLDGYTRAYAAAFASYARHELGFQTEMTYSLLSDDVNRRWDWAGGQGGETRSTASATSDLRDLLAVIPSFRLLVAHGYSDALTPYGSSKYVLDHLPSALAEGRTALKVYRGGHMFYTDPAPQQALTADARRFYQAGSPSE
ncbi:carboxypeptidase [Metarhizobium album]|uniref:Carboxypeptidase n=1 Tax=Metarhizobium album TaxID=2182425 RepID=A0A2U2DLN7_9HYPH|nr:carboxypeptidase [Rhizobium album]